MTAEDAEQSIIRRLRLGQPPGYLKGNQAARAMEQRANPNTLDHDIAYGDKDHTQQVTDLKVELKK